MTGSNHISQYRQSSVPVQTGTYSDGRPIYTFYADNAAQNGPTFNVSDYGATGDGVTDDTAAIQAAIAACQTAGGGTVLLATGVYLISSTLLVSVPDVTICGAGWATHLLAASGMTGSMLQYSLGGNIAGYMGDCALRDLWLDGNSQPVVNGVQLDATYHFELFHVRIAYCGGYSIYGNGDASYTGAYTKITDCHIEHGTLATSVGLYTNYHEWGACVNSFFDWFSVAGANAVELNNGNWRFANVGFDSNDTAMYLSYSKYTSIVGCQFERGYTQHLNLRGAEQVVLSGCHFGARAAGATGTIQVNVNDPATNTTIITGCTCNKDAWTYFVSEYPNTGTPGNTYSDNDTGGLAIALYTGTARNNRGYNPVGALASPAVPASGTPQSNTFGVDATVYVTGGTVTAIAVGGTTTGITSGPIRVPAGGTITLTYSVAPTWVWLGE